MMGFEWHDIVLHAAYLVVLVAYTLKDVLWMRFLLILGSAVDIFYRSVLVPDISYTDIYWCSGEIAINGYMVILLYRERRGLFFTEEEKGIYKMVFSNVPDIQFKRLLKVAEWQTVPENTCLVEQGTEIDTLMIIYEGLAKVEVDGNLLSYIRSGNFVGEMSFLTGNPTTAKVTTLMACRILVWNRTRLREVMAKDEELHNAMHSVFNGDLIAKLTKHASANSAPVVAES